MTFDVLHRSYRLQIFGASFRPPWGGPKCGGGVGEAAALLDTT